MRSLASLLFVVGTASLRLARARLARRNGWDEPQVVWQRS
jgi:hypothetical protein